MEGWYTMSENFKGSGKSQLFSSVDYDHINVSGKTFGDGNIKACSLKSSGKLEITGDLTVSESVDLSGKGTFNLVKCRNFTGSGKVSVSDSLNADENVTISGAFHIGDVTAKKCSFSISSFSEIRKLKSETVSVRKSNNSFSKEQFPENGDIKINIFGFKFEHHVDVEKINENVKHDAVLEVGSIESKFADVSNTTANEIIADDVIIGAGCNIKLVKYRNSYKCDSSSSVNKAVKE